MVKNVSTSLVQALEYSQISIPSIASENVDANRVSICTDYHFASKNLDHRESPVVFSSDLKNSNG